MLPLDLPDTQQLALTTMTLVCIDLLESLCLAKLEPMFCMLDFSFWIQSRVLDCKNFD